MKVVNLTAGSPTYTSNAYLVTGSWNRLVDVNTLVDVGRDPGLLERLEGADVGVGQRRLAQVILTHGHYDHASLLPELTARYHPTVCAFMPFEGVHRVLKVGEVVRLGDSWFEVLHIPGHSQDSICLVSAHDKVLFSGDTALLIRGADATHEAPYLDGLADLTRYDIRTVYPGHGPPMQGDITRQIAASLAEFRR